ncbi:MAG: hypothetical protein OXH31_10395 [Gammaproteobacteria bacterium]|nr:hypothetical protein [Gammaproteobacteria bacterium]
MHKRPVKPKTATELRVNTQKEVGLGVLRLLDWASVVGVCG